MESSKTYYTVSILGIGGMILLSLTQLVPKMLFSGYAVILGIFAFFACCIITGRGPRQCGLSFSDIYDDMRKPGVFMWLFAPAFISVVPSVIGNIIFNGEYTQCVLERAGKFLTYDNFWLLMIQIVVLALGEEIAWRGFFAGTTMRAYPFWLCTAISSFLFALGHLNGSFSLLVLFDLFFVFVNSCIFTVIYKKSGNCAVSAVSHILGNIVGLMVCFSMA